MQVYKAIQNRRSVRGYKAEPVPEKSLEKILDAARLAPSAHNSQDWKFVVVKNSEKKRRLAEAALEQDFIAEAPIIIVAVALDPEHTLSSGVPAYALNLAIAVDHMSLVATEEGLGSCWIGAFSQEKVKKVLKIPAQQKVVVLLPLGYPADSPKSKTRKNLKEIICQEEFK